MQRLVEIFETTKPITEIVLRGVGAFLALVILVRLIPKRNAGHISPNDMLVLIVIGGWERTRLWAARIRRVIFF